MIMVDAITEAVEDPVANQLRKRHRQGDVRIEELEEEVVELRRKMRRLERKDASLRVAWALLRVICEYDTVLFNKEYCQALALRAT